MPFHFEELMVRVEALLRRQNGEAVSSAITLGPWRLELERRALWVEQQPHILTATEFRLLQLLMRHPGKVFSKTALLTQMTEDPDERDPNMVEVYTRRLRKLLGKAAIETLRGQG